MQLETFIYMTTLLLVAYLVGAFAGYNIRADRFLMLDKDPAWFKHPRFYTIGGPIIFTVVVILYVIVKGC